MTSNSAEGPAGPPAGDSRPMLAERVTIVVPVYNRAGPLLDAALESLLSQDYPNLEILAIDDGSTDTTPRVLAQYAERHGDRFRWTRQDNAGTGRQRSTAGSSSRRGRCSGTSAPTTCCFPARSRGWSRSWRRTPTRCSPTRATG